MFSNVNELIKSDISYPIILLFGENEFSREEAQNLLIKKYVSTENDKFNFDIFDGDDTQISSLVDLCRSYPMMSDKRVVLVKRFDKLFSGRASKKNETSSPLSFYINSPSDTTILILVADIDGAKDISKTFKSSNKEQFNKKVATLKFPYNQLISKFGWMEFPRVYESEYAKWTEGRIKAKGRTIQPEALEILVSRTKQTLRDLSNEVDKLLLATEGQKQITLDEINFLTGSTREYSTFDLQKVIVERNLPKAVRILNKILAVDRQEMLMIVIFSKLFINLLKIYDDYKAGVPPQSLSTKIGISPYQFSDYQTALKKYNAREIEHAVMAICETDFKLKSSNPDSLMIMQNMLFEIMEKKNENTSLF